MTSGGDLYSSTGLTVTNNATFNGGITLGAGDDLIGSATSDITFNTDKFTVAGATGDTVIAGTCDITGATEVTGIATLGDASLLKTSAAPTTDAMITNKKYVDDQIAAYIASEVTLSAYTRQDSDSTNMLPDHAYLAATDGTVYAVATCDASEYIRIWVDTDNNPPSGGFRVQAMTSGSANRPLSVSAKVAEGEYFEVQSTGEITSGEIIWKSLGTLSKPVDQD